jgi:hypothetical protein
VAHEAVELAGKTGDGDGVGTGVPVETGGADAPPPWHAAKAAETSRI